MSTAVISYDSIMLASGIAQKMSEYFTDYADSIRSDVLNKLNSYSGPHTGYIDDAIGRMNNKIAVLDDDSTRFLKYSKDLSSLKDSCVRTDSMVKNTISTLSQTFCTNHNIRVSEVESTIAFLGVDFINENPVGRFVGTVAGEAIGTANSWKRDIEEWYDYEGGKQLISSIASITLDFVIMVGVTIASGGLLSPYGILSLMKCVDLGVDLGFEISAYQAAQDGDPVEARRLGKINNIKDFSQSSIKYGYDFQNYEFGDDEKRWNTFGYGWDIGEKGLDIIDKGKRKFTDLNKEDGLPKFGVQRGVDLDFRKNILEYYTKRDPETLQHLKNFKLPGVFSMNDAKSVKELMQSTPKEFLEYIEPDMIGLKFFGVRGSDYVKIAEDGIDIYEDSVGIYNTWNGPHVKDHGLDTIHNFLYGTN